MRTSRRVSALYSWIVIGGVMLLAYSFVAAVALLAWVGG